jgi:DNA polymerase elongation subunit (family B)
MSDRRYTVRRMKGSGVVDRSGKRNRTVRQKKNGREWGVVCIEVEVQEGRRQGDRYRRNMKMVKEKTYICSSRRTMGRQGEQAQLPFSVEKSFVR